MNSPIVLLAILVGLLCAITAAGVLAEWRWDNNAPLSIAAAANAVISFFGLLALSALESGQWTFSESSMRTAIAGAIVIEYLVLVGIASFFTAGPRQLPVITQTIITNFTTIVGIVIAFYFGASAYLQAQQAQGNVSKTFIEATQQEPHNKTLQLTR